MKSWCRRAGGWDRSGCAQGAPRSANRQGEEQHSHTERGSHTRRDKGECSRQGGGGQRGRRGSQDSGNRPESRARESMRMGGSDNKGDGLASQPRRYRVPGQPLLNGHQVGGVSRSPEGLFAQQEGEPIGGRPAVRGKGTTWAPQPTPHTNTSNPPRGAQVPPIPPMVPPARPSVPLHRHFAQQDQWPSRRPSDPTGAGSSDSQWASRAHEELRERVSARRGWGTQRANPGAPAAQSLCLPVPRGPCTQWATTGAPEAFGGVTSARRGSCTRGANPGAPAAQHRCSSAPRGSSTQSATAGAPEAHCRKNWWARQGKESRQNRGVQNQGRRRGHSAP